MDIPWMWYQMAIGEVPMQVQAEVGVRARWLLGDMIALAQHLRAGASRQLLPIFKPDFSYKDDFTWTDPISFFREASDYLYKFLQSCGSFIPDTQGMVR